MDYGPGPYTHLISSLLGSGSHQELKMLSALVGAIVVILARISFTGHRTSTDTPSHFGPDLAKHVGAKIYIFHTTT